LSTFGQITEEQILEEINYEDRNACVRGGSCIGFEFIWHRAQLWIRWWWWADPLSAPIGEHLKARGSIFSTGLHRTGFVNLSELV